MKSLKIILPILLVIFHSAVQANPADDIKPLVLTHFMPWNVAPPISSNWGWHWTMNHFNPNNTDANGKRDIASHYYPLTGPYDSMDPDIMEYQVLLMKLSGIDGVIVDWYGTGNLYDYPGINDRTNAMFEYIEKAGLKFSICYEDQTLTNLINQNIISDDEKYEQGKKDITYIQDTWFNKEAHATLDGKPLLFIFGPQYFKQNSEWQDIFSALDSAPLFFTEDNRIAPAAVGAYPWPPMWKTTSSGVLTQASLQEYLTAHSNKAKAWPYRMSSAFPGFHDIYKEAGVSNGYGFLDADGGSTFRLTMEHALSDNPHIIQLVTWNDYGEGTIIEPTEEFGYLYLEMMQDYRKNFIEADFQPHAGHLRMPLQIYNARKENPNNAAIHATLDQVFDLFVAMELDAAYALLKTIVAVETPDVNNVLESFELSQNYPNPFNPKTTIQYYLPSHSKIRLSIYNSTGQLVNTLVDEFQSSGQYAVVWDAGDAPSGLYFFQLETRDAHLTQKCVLVR
jgi:hypothetical protein